MKIISYNINGIRAAIKKGFLNWLEEENPDVLCLQEIKATPDQFNTNEFKNLGYHCVWHPAQKKGYSGVAILCKKHPISTVVGCGVKSIDCEGRIVKVELNKLNILSCYFPSGSSGDIRQAFKMKFLNYFSHFVKNNKQGINTLICGDFNICHKEIDIHNPIVNRNTSGFLPEEREWLDQFLKLGFIDTFRVINPNPHCYSWWSYRAQSRKNNKGWRIDYHMLSKNLKNSIVDARILHDIHHSDHCPILLEIQQSL